MEFTQRLNVLLMNVKEDSENASFKLNIQKAKIGGGPKMAEE